MELPFSGRLRVRGSLAIILDQRIQYTFVDMERKGDLFVVDMESDGMFLPMCFEED